MVVTAWKTSLSRPLQPPLGEDIILQDIPSIRDSLWNWSVTVSPHGLTKLYNLTRELLKVSVGGQLSKWSCFTRRGADGWAQCRKSWTRTTLLQYSKSSSQLCNESHNMYFSYSSPTSSFKIATIDQFIHGGKKLKVWELKSLQIDLGCRPRSKTWHRSS